MDSIESSGRWNLKRRKVLGLALGGVLLTLASAWWFARVVAELPCVLAFFPVAVMGSVIARGLWEWRAVRRRAWLGLYLRSGSWWWRVLQPGLLMRAGATIVGLGLAAAWLFEWLRWGWPLLVLLTLNAPVFYAVVVAVQWLLRNEAHARWVGPLASVLAVRVNIVLLLLALTVMQLFGNQSDYRGLAHSSVLVAVGAVPAYECGVMGTLVRANVYWHESMQWGLQNAVGDAAAGGVVALLAWMFWFLMSGGMAWAWSRFLVGLLPAHEVAP